MNIYEEDLGAVIWWEWGMKFKQATEKQFTLIHVTIIYTISSENLLKDFEGCSTQRRDEKKNLEKFVICRHSTRDYDFHVVYENN